MATVAETRGITYSAEATGNCGTLRCHVVRRPLVDDARAQYSIFVSNETSADAQASAFVPELPAGRYRPITRTTVAAAADFSTTVSLDNTPAGALPELHVALSAGHIHFTLTVPALNLEPTGLAGSPLALIARPMQPVFDRMASVHALVAEQRAQPIRALVERTVRGRSAPAVTAFAAFTVMIVAAALVAFHPRIDELRVPPRAVAGSAVEIAYRATGLGSIDYTVLDADGHTVVAAPLSFGAGRFTVALPASAPAAYRVRVEVRSPLGSPAAEAYVRTAAAAPRPARAPEHRATAVVAAPPPQIRSLALDRATLVSGDTLNVYYDVDATNGSIELLDAASQIAYGKSGLSPSGRTAFVVPVVQTPRFFTVVLTAQRGNATTQSRVAVSAVPASTPSPTVDGNNDAASDAVAGPFVVAPKSVRSAAIIPVEVIDATAGLMLTLQDADGTEIARREFPAASARARTAFTAPAVRRATTLRLQATYPKGNGSETTLQSIDVQPG